MLFSRHFHSSIWIGIKSKNLKIHDGGCLWQHLCSYGCYGNHIETTWFHFKIEGTKKAHYIAKYQVDQMNGVESRGEGPIDATPHPPYTFV